MIFCKIALLWNGLELCWVSMPLELLWCPPFELGCGLQPALPPLPSLPLTKILATPLLMNTLIETNWNKCAEKVMKTLFCLSSGWLWVQIDQIQQKRPIKRDQLPCWLSSNWTQPDAHRKKPVQLWQSCNNGTSRIQTRQSYHHGRRGNILQQNIDRLRLSELRKETWHAC